jgi:hypothetical protein
MKYDRVQQTPPRNVFHFLRYGFSIHAITYHLAPPWTKASLLNRNVLQVGIP